MDHVCKSALAKELQEKTNGTVSCEACHKPRQSIQLNPQYLLCARVAALLQERWEMLLVKLRQTQQQIRACETAMVFAFVEVRSRRGHCSSHLSDQGHFKYETKTMNIKVVFISTVVAVF